MPEARLTAPEVDLNHPAEVARHLFMPTQVYPLFEQALRHAAGRSVDDHLVHVSELWAGFSAVAAEQPARVDPRRPDGRADPHARPPPTAGWRGRTRRS